MFQDTISENGDHIKARYLFSPFAYATTAAYLAAGMFLYNSLHMLAVCAGQPRSPLPEALHPKAAAQAAANAARAAAAFQQQRPIGKLQHHVALKLNFCP